MTAEQLEYIAKVCEELLALGVPMHAIDPIYEYCEYLEPE